MKAIKVYGIALLKIKFTSWTKVSLKVHNGNITAKSLGIFIFNVLFILAIGAR
jgi:prolipoprotein diacylglyceryltransferase